MLASDPTVLTVHPIPYQGSKRRLAPIILEFIRPAVSTVFEPFAGSAAVTLACAKYERGRAYHINDSLKPLMGIWRMVVTEPDRLADEYESLWYEQLAEPRAYYDRVRERFNTDPSPSSLLFLVARCVKNAVRFNASGHFNQSPDMRRKGTQPARMRKHIHHAHRLLRGRTTLTCEDYSRVLDTAGPDDLVYMDPPYQGTSGDRDQRYHEQLDLNRFVDELSKLRQRGVPFVVSLDGQCGTRSYGLPLPDELGLARIAIHTGRSSQATLNGRSDETTESLYISPELADDRSVRLWRSIP
tara:strand:- start:15074 stop:15970 length:897 start_codon:yes stop_codon:yes gene_type:complete